MVVPMGLSLEANGTDIVPLASPSLAAEYPTAIDPQHQQYWGQQCEKEEENTTRLWYNNVNGIKSESKADAILLHQYFKEAGVDVAMICEHNLNTEQFTAQQLLKNVGLQTHNSFRVSATNNDVFSKSNYKPGGTATMAMGRMPCKVADSGIDPTGMGRWSYITFRGKEGVKVTVVTAYRVCPKAIGACGPTTSTFVQCNKLLQQGKDQPNPRKQILEDLQDQIITWTMEGHDVILGIDANDDVDRNNSEIQRFFDETGLISAHEHLYEEDFYDDNPLPPTFIYGKKKTDFIACTPRIFSCIKRCWIEPANMGIESDHRALAIDLDTELTFNGTIPNIATENQRIVKSTCTRTALRYREELHKILTDGSIYLRLRRLQTQIRREGRPTNNAKKKAKKLDREVTAAMLKAKDRCRYNRKHDAWSPKLIERCLKLKYWSIKMKETRTNKDMSHVLDPIAEKYEDLLDGELVTDEEEIKNRWLEAKSEMKEAKKRAIELRDEHLAELAKAKAIQNNVTAEAAIKQIRQTEMTRRMFAYLQ